MRKSTNNCRSLVSKPTIKKQYEGYSLFGIVSCWTGREVCFFHDFPLYLDITFSRNFSHHAFLRKKVSLTHCFVHLFGTLPPVVARRHSDCGGNASSKAVPWTLAPTNQVVARMPAPTNQVVVSTPPTSVRPTFPPFSPPFGES